MAGIETPIVRFLGGEAGHRGFFGGTTSRTRMVLVGVFVLAGLVLTPLIGWPGLLIGLGGAGATLLLTARTHRGSILERHTKRARWAARRRTGADRYAPFDARRRAELEQELEGARAGRHGGGAQAADAAARLAGMRGLPDAALGMGWLQSGRGVPGIQWHHSPAGDPYLAVVFEVSGQLAGMTSTPLMNQAAEAWGAFLASCASPTSLAREVQVSTRVPPADSARQEWWVATGLDPALPTGHPAVSSYAQVLAASGADAMVQRHTVTVSWPITAAFRDAAARYGEGRDGWRALMVQEIAAITRGLAEARLGTVEVLTARQTVAAILHQQNPARPVDLVHDADPARLGLPSRDEYSATVTTSEDPAGRPVVWWHRTAAIRAENLAIAPRRQLWMLDLLIGSQLRFIRTVSFHLRLVPAAEAKAQARIDLTRDRAAALSDQEQGRLADADAQVQMSAAARRAQDLAAGSRHHGADWVGYITITAPRRELLAQASRQLEDVCATGLGIERLEWQDSMQAGASGATWPIGRGLAQASPSISARLYDHLAGHGDKEALT